VDSVLQVLFSGLTLGAMYAISAVALALIWGVVGMLNVAHGVLLAAGGYVSFSVVTYLGWPWPVGLPAAAIVGLVLGGLVYLLIVRWMFRSAAFEVGIIIATVGLAIVLENLMIRIFTGYPKKQPFLVEGGIRVSEVLLPYQTLIIIAIAAVMVLLLSGLLTQTRMGRAIRAVAQSREAAVLMGVPVARVYFQVLVIGGAIAAVSGVLLTSVTTLAPAVGNNPMLKAFIICVIAGLGNIPGSVYAAIVLGLFESVIQYVAGARFGFPAMLALVIVVLIWRPYGVFGRRTVTRV
jgi:branched-chain amino acid transport system permease protein